MPDIFLRANRCIMDYPLTIPNRQTFDTSKKYLVFYTLILSDISLQCMHLHFPVQNNFIKVALFTKARFRFWVSNFKEFLFCNLQRM